MTTPAGAVRPGAVGAVRTCAAADSNTTTDGWAAGKRAVVVGAGPAGALTAMLLARQGFRVDVFERLAPLVDDEGKVQASIGPRSYNILLNERAVAALDSAGADFHGFDVADLQYMMRHRLKGDVRQGFRIPIDGRLKLANRAVLAGALVQHCLAQHGDRVQFHFDHELSALDSTNSTAYFRPVGSATVDDAAATGSGGTKDASALAGSDGDSGASTSGAVATVLTQERLASSAASRDTANFDLLVGADGANSLVRQLLQQHDPQLGVDATRDVMEYRTCVLGGADQFLPEGVGPQGTFHTWSNSKLQASIIGSSTHDGQLRVVFALPEGVHATLQTAAAIEAYLAHAIPSLPADAVNRAAPQLADSPISNGGTIIRCSKLHSGRVVLVGDAGHSVYPSLGQGANAALQGAATLAAVLHEVGAEDLESAAAEYTRRWLPNAHAVADLSVEAYGNNARAFAPNLKLAQIIFQMVLHKLLPFLVPKPAFFQINSTSVPYKVLWQRTTQEMLLFKASLVALAAAAAAMAVRNLLLPALAAAGVA